MKVDTPLAGVKESKREEIEREERRAREIGGERKERREETGTRRREMNNVPRTEEKILLKGAPCEAGGVALAEPIVIPLLLAARLGR